MNAIQIDEYAGSYLPLEGLKVTKTDGNWVEGVVDGHWFQAKVFTEPSEYGINDGRISKLCVSKSDKWEGFYPSKILFNYDRGLDLGRPDLKIVKKLLAVFA